MVVYELYWWNGGDSRYFATKELAQKYIKKCEEESNEKYNCFDDYWLGAHEVCTSEEDL